MKRTRTDIASLIAELQLDCSQLDELQTLNERAQERIQRGAQDTLDYSALGYTIHNIYGTMENSCLRISKFFENNLSSDGWHRDLLRRMILTISGTRPAFLTQEAYTIIDELQAFRHVFRNAYQRPLDPERLQLLQQKVSQAIQLFKKAVEAYQSFLEQLSKHVED